MKFRISRIARLRKKTQLRLENYTNEVTEFYIMTSLASALASLGLIMDNTAIIIGAMVLSPLIVPIIEFSLALLAFDIERFIKSLINLIIASASTIIIAFLLGKLAILISGNTLSITNEMFVRTNPNIFYFLVAIFSGVAGAYGYSKPKILESLTSIAIAVAIVPPLAVSGLGFSIKEYSLAYESLILFLFNLSGIFFGSILLYVILGFGKDIEIKNK